MKTNIHEKPEIRELTLKNGILFPSDKELVMLILGSGTKQKPVEALAEEVRAAILSSNSDVLVENLLKIGGIGQGRALALAAAVELGRRMNRSPQAVIENPVDVIPYIKGYTLQSSEHFIAITLNGAREIISIRVVCVGTGNIAVLRPADVFAEAVKERASAIIVSHNHPSGHVLPSMTDVDITKTLVRSAELLGISFLDHLIITKDSYFSFLENNLLDPDAVEHAQYSDGENDGQPSADDGSGWGGADCPARPAESSAASGDVQNPGASPFLSAPRCEAAAAVMELRPAAPSESPPRAACAPPPFPRVYAPPVASVTAAPASRFCVADSSTA